MIRFRIIFLVMAILTLLFILAPLFLGLASTVFTYQGKCHGFTDGSWACSWQEYATDQVFWSALLDIPLSLYLGPCWFVALGLWFYNRRPVVSNVLPISLVILIPLGGCLGGTCLISILPVFIRLFYGFYPKL
jgi:hypothetical protein